MSQERVWEKMKQTEKDKERERHKAIFLCIIWWYEKKNIPPLTKLLMKFFFCSLSLVNYWIDRENGNVIFPFLLNQRASKIQEKKCVGISASVISLISFVLLSFVSVEPPVFHSMCLRREIPISLYIYIFVCINVCVCNMLVEGFCFTNSQIWATSVDFNKGSWIACILLI